MIPISKPNRTYIRLKYLILISIAIVFFLLSFYWLKNRIGINLLQTISLSKYFPFKHVAHPRIIGMNQQGVLLWENFDSYRIFKNWHGIYIEGDGKVIQSISSSGRYTSNCLIIINSEVKNWSISHNKFVKVNMGDHFVYSAKVKVSVGNPTANICVDSFDENMKIITWGYSKITLSELGKWVNLVNSFSINDKKIIYIRLRINGIGEGTYHFDDIIFKRKVETQ